MNVLQHEFIYEDNIIFRESNMKDLIQQELHFASPNEDKGLRFDNPYTNFTYATSDLPSKRLDIPILQPKKNVGIPLPTTRILGYKIQVDNNGNLAIDEEATIKDIRVKT